MNDVIQRGAEAMRAKRRELIAQPLDRIWTDLMRVAIRSYLVNPRDKLGVNPGIKYDDVGKISLLAIGGGFVLCRRGNCYPMIRTESEWEAMSDTPPVYAAEQRGTFHMGQTERGQA